MTLEWAVRVKVRCGDSLADWPRAARKASTEAMTRMAAGRKATSNDTTECRPAADGRGFMLYRRRQV